MQKRLTKTMVETARPGAGRVIIWDAGDRSVKGFGLKIMPSGHKSYVYQYRLKGGRRATTQRYTIGPCEDWTVERARERAIELGRIVGRGEHPIAQDRATLAQEKAEKAAVLAAQEGRVELVLTSYLKLLERRSRPLRSLPERKRLFKAEIADAEEKSGVWFGSLVSELTRKDVRDLLQKIVDRGSPYTAVQVLRALVPFFAYVVGRGFRADNPAAGISLIDDLGVVTDARDRHLSVAELKSAYCAAGTLSFPFKPLFRLLILTAQRRSEVAGIHERELSPATTTPWVIPAARAKNRTKHVVHLSPQALAELKELPKAHHPMLFSAKGRKPASGFTRAKKTWDKASGIKKWRLHDLRRTFATLAVDELKIPPHVADAILNHKTGVIRGVARTYNHAEFLEERESALDAWGLFIENLVASDSKAKDAQAAIIAAAHYHQRLEEIRTKKAPNLVLLSNAKRA